MSALWTISELAERVAASLADDSGGQPSARVRELPDPRTIRWYQTTGLVDRPAALRGRTALYGHRHLLQLVAIKRLQAAGRSLSVIQAELAGMSSTELALIASMPADPAPAADDHTAVRPRFWATPPATPEPEPAAPAPADLVSTVRLGPGVLLVLDPSTRALDHTDLEAVRTAAGPLLDLLRRRDLVPRTHSEEPR